ncbi:hypothetical protein OG705_28890 [Streptomyces sp. NBC_00838]|uniref:hypothetical protein n=1 Tax=Streptomyces sp. NBC_00838 TaxID=2903680 RepID=UPI00386BE1D7|nr:hypothetical protein OG705_28890 [Streptomyces sp. NBC_00838]
MRTWKTREVGISAVTSAVAAGVALGGCSGGGLTRAQPSSAPSPTARTVKVTDKALGEALDKLVFHDEADPGKEAGACLTAATRKAGMSAQALVYLVKTGGDDAGSVIAGLDEVSRDDAVLLGSRSLREKFDACVDKTVPPSGNNRLTAQSYTAPALVSKPTAGKPNPSPKPAYPVRANQPVSSPIELTKGLVSMFSSYARDEGQEKTYAAAGQCLSTLVYNAGFTQNALHFLAGGAPLGTGSIVEHLPNGKDKAIWQSPRFIQGLIDCTTNATPTSLPGP